MTVTAPVRMDGGMETDEQRAGLSTPVGPVWVEAADGAITRAGWGTDRDSTDGPDAPGWSEDDRLLLLAADELRADQRISDSTWAGLARRWDRQQMMDIVFTVGNYTLVAMALNSFGVPLDAGVPGFPRGRSG